MPKNEPHSNGFVHERFGRGENCWWTMRPDNTVVDWWFITCVITLT